MATGPYQPPRLLKPERSTSLHCHDKAYSLHTTHNGPRLFSQLCSACPVVSNGVLLVRCPVVVGSAVDLAQQLFSQPCAFLLET